VEVAGEDAAREEPGGPANAAGEVAADVAGEGGADVPFESCPLAVRSMPDDWPRRDSESARREPARLRSAELGEKPRPNCLTAIPSYRGL
jgi:hypothetical protein